MSRRAFVVDRIGCCVAGSKSVDHCCCYRVDDDDVDGGGAADRDDDIADCSDESAG